MLRSAAEDILNQTPIEWDGQTHLDSLPDRVRLKVTFEGRKNTNIRFNAIYMR